MAESYKRARFRTSLNRPLTLMGGERTPVLLSMLFSAYMAFVFAYSGAYIKAAFVGGTVWSVLLGILVRMGKNDMQMLAVWWRGRRYKSFYPARGRFGAPVPDFKPFISRR